MYYKVFMPKINKLIIIIKKGTYLFFGLSYRVQIVLEQTRKVAA